MNRKVQTILLVVIASLISVVGAVDAQSLSQADAAPRSVAIPVLQEDTDEPTPSLTFDELGIGNVSLVGKFAWAGVWIPFQSNWEFDEPIIVDMNYIASPILIDDAAIAVTANDTDIASLRPIIDGEEHSFSFVIPPMVLASGEGGMYLEFEGFLPLTREECEAPNNAGQWVSILDTTALVLDPALSEAPPTLEDLPEAIVVQDAPDEAPPVVFVLPENPDTSTLTAAAKAAGWLGTGVQEDHLPFVVETANSLSEAQREAANLVVIGLPDAHPFFAELSEAISNADPEVVDSEGDPVTLLTEDEEVAADLGVIQVINSPWNAVNNVLIISGGGTEGLEKAGEILVDPERLVRSSESGLIVRSVPRLPEATARPWQNSITSFSQLGYEDVRVEGTGIADAYFFFPRPAGWLFTDNTTVTLHMAANPSRTVIDSNETQSYVDIYANETYIGTVNFEEQSQENEVWVTFDLPARVLNVVPDTGARPQLIALRMSVSHTDRLFCNQVSVERYWTTIYADSFLTTQHTIDDQLPNLQLFPYPFLNTDAQVGIVLEPEPTNEEIALGLSIAATLGQAAFTSFDVVMTTADAASVTDYQGANLILLGQRNEHPLLDEFVASEAATHGVDNYPAEPNIGFLHELVSPWNAERIALAVYSNTPEGLDNAAQALFVEGPPVEPPGSIALVEGEHIAHIFYRSPDLNFDPGPPPVASTASSQPVATDPPTSEATGDEVAEAPSETEAPAEAPDAPEPTAEPSTGLLQIIRENGGTPLALLLGGLAVLGVVLLLLRGGSRRRVDTDTPRVFIDAEDAPDQTPPFTFTDEDE